MRFNKFKTRTNFINFDVLKVDVGVDKIDKLCRLISYIFSLSLLHNFIQKRNKKLN